MVKIGEAKKRKLSDVEVSITSGAIGRPTPHP